MAKLFEDMLKDEEYTKLYDKIDEKERQVLMEAMRALVTDFETNVLDVLVKQLNNVSSSL